MRAGTGISRVEDTVQAAAEAGRQALLAAGGARVFVVAATPEHLDQALDLSAALRELQPGVRIVGGAADIASVFGDEEPEEGPVLAVLALDGGEPFALHRNDASSLREAMRKAGPRSTVLVFADPDAPQNRLVATLMREAPSAGIAGGGVSVEGGLLFDEDVIDADAVGVVLPVPPRLCVAQSHQPIGQPMLVTRVEGRSILELDGASAVDALSELSNLPGMSEDALQFLALGVAPLPGEPFNPDDFLAIPLLGVDDDTGALELAAPVAEGTSASFTLRDGMGARRTLTAALDKLGPARPGFGVYFDCASRGSSLHGVPGLDLRLIEKHFGRFPLLALRTSFELGPAGPGTGIHLFSGVLALGT